MEIGEYSRPTIGKTRCLFHLLFTLTFALRIMVFFDRAFQGSENSGVLDNLADVPLSSTKHFLLEHPESHHQSRDGLCLSWNTR